MSTNTTSDAQESRKEYVDKALEHYKMCTDRRERRKNLIMTTVATFVILPIVLSVIMALFTGLIKFAQLCTGWIGL